MLDLKRIRKNKEEIKKALKNRGEHFEEKIIDELLDFDEKRRRILIEVEVLKNKKNQDSIEIGKLKKEGKGSNFIVSEIKRLTDKIKQFDIELSEVDSKIEYLMLRIPNIPHMSVPEGETDSDNVEIRRWSKPTKFNFNPKAHWDIGADLNILDFERGGKVTGSRFMFYRGLGARLERAVITYFLDVHTEEHGYEELFPPYMVNRNSMVGTGQLPKFEEDTFRISNSEFFLIPTAEVPVTNFYRDEVLKGEDLPIKHVAYSACFRSESSSAGRDTRGLVRQRQFNKVELVKFTKPEQSYDELEKLTNDAEEILQRLHLPYRVVKICKGDLGFTAALKYDIEVWMPSYNRFVEISSCSNFEDFQARRANIKYKETSKDRPQYVHTLNGSGLAAGRTVAAILENYQQEDGSVIIPEVLRQYMGGKEKIK
ncbi:serine--tRNA ligase [Clostridium scatologenes]|uniref:Serine--tRNA ligase n=1 Tax=Clostridium scatologenes TaxID=1548 RepID=A0A0E3JQU4_CLOSL|nr:serine--tRNA ligase [Clostridium scatologenes]AKA71235.1 seryl-tRNA synthetase [Clostridium scatologenes]